MKKLVTFLLIISFSLIALAEEDEGPYAKDLSDPSESGLHDIQTIEDYDNPGGPPEKPKQENKEDPCKVLNKKKKEMEKQKEEIAKTVEEVCISDAEQCAKLRKQQKQFDEQFPVLQEKLKVHNCD